MSPSSSSDDLVRAAGQGDVDRVAELLRGGVDANTVDEAGWTALHRAASSGARVFRTTTLSFTEGGVTQTDSTREADERRVRRPGHAPAAGSRRRHRAARSERVDAALQRDPSGSRLGVPRAPRAGCERRCARYGRRVPPRDGGVARHDGHHPIARRPRRRCQREGCEGPLHPVGRAGSRNGRRRAVAHRARIRRQPAGPRGVGAASDGGVVRG